MSSDDEYEAAAKHHYLSLAATFGAAAYAWQVHSFWVGVAVLLGLWAAVTATNFVIMRRLRDHDDIDQTFKTMRRFRWAWIILAFVVIALSGATFSPNR